MLVAIYFYNYLSLSNFGNSFVLVKANEISSVTHYSLRAKAYELHSESNDEPNLQNSGIDIVRSFWEN